VADDEAYSREDIQKMLAYSDLRGRLIILLLVSSGMRLGGLSNLKMGDIDPIYDPEAPSRVIAAHLRVYAHTESEYSTFITPEAWDCLATYRTLRESWGEPITKDSPVLLKRFDKQTLKEGRAQPLHPHTIQHILITTRNKAGVDVKSKQYNDKRFTIKSVHGTRKCWNTTVKSVKGEDGRQLVSHENKELMMGHRLVGSLALGKVVRSVRDGTEASGRFSQSGASAYDLR
jgi:integrase